MSVSLHTSVTPIMGGSPISRKISLGSYEDFVCMEEAMGQISFSNGSSLELSGAELRLAELVRNQDSFQSPMFFYDEDAEEIAVLFRVTSKIRRRLNTLKEDILINGASGRG